MNNRTRKLTNLIWIKHRAFWIYQCSTCQKVELEPKEEAC